jgi:hypothetical protein
MEENVQYFKIDEPEVFGYVRKNGKKAIFVNKYTIEFFNFKDIKFDLYASTKNKFDKAFHKLAYKINTQF